jgi:hypothetical protein
MARSVTHGLPSISTGRRAWVGEDEAYKHPGKVVRGVALPLESLIPAGQDLGLCERRSYETFQSMQCYLPRGGHV